jgi:hypothetical protein
VVAGERAGAGAVLAGVLFVLRWAVMRDPLRAAAFVGALSLAVIGALAMARLAG